MLADSHCNFGHSGQQEYLTQYCASDFIASGFAVRRFWNFCEEISIDKQNDLSIDITEKAHINLI